MNLADLIRSIAPPEVPLTGGLEAVRELVGQHLSFGEEFWGVAESYGAGAFHGRGGLRIVHPSEQGFLMLVVGLLEELHRNHASTLKELGSRWLPVAEYGEWAAFVKADGSSSPVLFACLGELETSRLFAGSFIEFIARFSTSELQHQLFGAAASQARPGGNFIQADFQREMKLARLERSVSLVPDNFFFVEQLAQELSPHWVLDLQLR